jgi:site-specific recombinase XerD
MTAITQRIVPADVGSTDPRLLDLVPSFTRHLRAENKAPRTIEAYVEAVRRLHEFLVDAGMPTVVRSITREHVESFVADQADRLAAASARTRYASLRQFFAWAEDEGEIERSPMSKMKPPKVPERPVPVLGMEQLRALVRVAERDTTFYGRRDAAILRVFVDSGARLAEVAGLRVADVDLESGTVRFVGKGRRVRINPIGSKTVRALDRYVIRARARHPDHASEGLWLGRQGEMTSYGVAEAVQRRALEAGIGRIHVHQLRHSAAHHLRLEGADDDAVLRLMGWRDRSMLHRYGSSAADERAAQAHRRLGLGDRL